MSKITFGIGLGALSLTLLTSCVSTGTTTAPASSPAATGVSSPTDTPGTSAPGGVPTYTMGQSVQVKNEDGAYTETVSQAHYTTKPGDQFSTPQHGGWLVATVDIAVTSGHMSFNPLYFTLVGPDGSRWDVDLAAAGYKPDLSSGDLNAGEKTHGYIAFDAPSSATGPEAKIAATDVLLSTVAYWSL
ncbi:DUF4352 domain-containing protein [Kitasatospora sp. YST-16]|uniref:DUF4352 domain-containing protein n=1 Tax=Kitasatospora sp. YST-16 TaxID=2998080 RepID=UPI0022845507|nr:DUF4352 domain-containing protein [Kitasatospora sp. YST-16]WAL71692.1 DUF4352 domain-containing protein [Kitasatospora sp. YST-16]WNW37733.1 DUF4352 domain-containing protein [Streptomyces sp. Li-HN-5-13]